MNIFVIGGVFPCYEHTAGSASMVLYHMVNELLKRKNKVSLQIVLGENEYKLSEAENSTEVDLKKRGVTMLTPFFKNEFMSLAYHRKREFSAIFNPVRIAKSVGYRLGLIGEPMISVYPASSLAPMISQRLKETRSDVALIVWNPECLAATYRVHEIPKLVYFGMPDHISPLKRLEDQELFGLRFTKAEIHKKKRFFLEKEKMHIKLMNDCEVTGNLCAEHAEYYRNHGHPRSLYMQNMWPDILGESGAALNETINQKPKIFGSMGPPGVTGNTYGLLYIVKEIIPLLNDALGEEGYEINIYGTGEPQPKVKELLKEAKSVTMRGWVKDIDKEIMTSDVFLVANNTSRYQGSHTRFLHAWSLKSCCVAHGYNVKANPEMIHGENILIGDTPEEMVGQLIKALNNPDLRKYIGQGGYDTYKKYFTPKAVVGRMIDEMQALVNVRER